MYVCIIYIYYIHTYIYYIHRYTYIYITASDNTSFLKYKTKLEISEINGKLPNIYWIPIFPKNHNKASFIIDAPKF